MASDQRQALYALLRADFPSFVRKVFTTVNPGAAFVDNWHILALCQQMLAVQDGKCRRLVVNLPPRSLKSLIVSVAFPAWVLGHKPTSRIIVASYSDDLTRRLARDFRLVLEAGWYQAIFPGTRIDRRKNTEAEVATTRGGGRYATSVGGTLTGRGGDIIIIDDPIKSADADSEVERRRVNEWFDSTVISRLDNPARGAIAVVMQRVHEDDLSGHLLQKGNWQHLRIPAIATEPAHILIGDEKGHKRQVGDLLEPNRMSAAHLDEARLTLGSRQFQAQYQQDPVPAEGNLFKMAWLRRYDEVPDRQPADTVVQSWDTASKIGSGNDYSVCTTWLLRKGIYFLLQVHRGQWEFPDLLRRVRSHATDHGASTILIEDANSGAALLQSLKHQGGLNVIGIKAQLGKQDRAAQQTAVFEAERVLLPRDAPWLAMFEAELLGFPNARYDDQVDSVVQFLHWAEARLRSTSRCIVPVSITRPPPWCS